MPDEIKIVAANDYATKDDLEQLNDSTPSPSDVDEINANLKDLHALLGAYQREMGVRVQASGRVLFRTLLGVNLLALIGLAAIVYKLYFI